MKTKVIELTPSSFSAISSAYYTSQGQKSLTKNYFQSTKSLSNVNNFPRLNKRIGNGLDSSDRKNLISWYESLRQEETWKQLKKKLDDEQTDVFKLWINEIFSTHISLYNLHNNSRQFYTALMVNNLYEDLQDGIRIIYLLEIVYETHLKKEFGFSKLADSKLHKLKNFEICIEFLENERKVKCYGINPIDLADGNKKILMGLLFLIKNNHEACVMKQNLANETKFKIIRFSTIPSQVLKRNTINSEKFLKIKKKLKLDSDPESKSHYSYDEEKLKKQISLNVESFSKSYSGSINDFLTFPNSHGYFLADKFLLLNKSIELVDKSGKNVENNQNQFNELKERISNKSLTKDSPVYDLVNGLVHVNTKLDEIYINHVKNLTLICKEENHINYNDDKNLLDEAIIKQEETCDNKIEDKLSSDEISSLSSEESCSKLIEMLNSNDYEEKLTNKIDTNIQNECLLNNDEENTSKKEINESYSDKENIQLCFIDEIELIKSRETEIFNDVQDIDTEEKEENEGFLLDKIGIIQLSNEKEIKKELDKEHLSLTDLNKVIFQSKGSDSELNSSSDIDEVNSKENIIFNDKEKQAEVVKEKEEISKLIINDRVNHENFDDKKDEISKVENLDQEKTNNRDDSLQITNLIECQINNDKEDIPEASMVSVEDDNKIGELVKFNETLNESTKDENNNNSIDEKLIINNDQNKAEIQDQIQEIIGSTSNKVKTPECFDESNSNLKENKTKMEYDCERSHLNDILVEKESIPEIFNKDESNVFQSKQKSQKNLVLVEEINNDINSKFPKEPFYLKHVNNVKDANHSNENESLLKQDESFLFENNSLKSLLKNNEQNENDINKANEIINSSNEIFSKMNGDSTFQSDNLNFVLAEYDKKNSLESEYCEKRLIQDKTLSLIEKPIIDAENKQDQKILNAETIEEISNLNLKYKEVQHTKKQHIENETNAVENFFTKLSKNEKDNLKTKKSKSKNHEMNTENELKNNKTRVYKMKKSADDISDKTVINTTIILNDKANFLDKPVLSKDGISSRSLSIEGNCNNLESENSNISKLDKKIELIKEKDKNIIKVYEKEILKEKKSSKIKKNRNLEFNDESISKLTTNFENNINHELSKKSVKNYPEHHKLNHNACTQTLESSKKVKNSEKKTEILLNILVDSSSSPLNSFSDGNVSRKMDSNQDELHIRGKASVSTASNKKENHKSKLNHSRKQTILIETCDDVKKRKSSIDLFKQKTKNSTLSNIKSITDVRNIKLNKCNSSIFHKVKKNTCNLLTKVFMTLVLFMIIGFIYIIWSLDNENLNTIDFFAFLNKHFSIS